MAMLPTAPARDVSLADVLSSCLAVIDGGTPTLPQLADARGVQRGVVVLVDGLGAAALKARAGHARTLAPRLGSRSVIESGFPTTTAAALASLATGLRPGRHGLVGYRVLDPATDTVFNQLSGWRGTPEPEAWQPHPTVFERATAAGIPSYAIGPDAYADSRLTRAILRGAQYVGARTLDDRIAAAQRRLDAGGRGLVYLYVPELDMAAHAHGWQSPQWTAALEQLDAAIARLCDGLRRDEGVFVTADHGMVDVPASSQIVFDQRSELIDGVRHVAGEPRCLQLHLEPDAPLEALADAWRDAEGSRAWIATREEAIEAGWFGPEVDAAVRPRIGDLLIAARAQVAYYDSRTATPQNFAMVGQHGSFSPEELRVPLIGFGAFAR